MKCAQKIEGNVYFTVRLADTFRPVGRGIHTIANAVKVITITITEWHRIDIFKRWICCGKALTLHSYIRSVSAGTMGTVDTAVT